jgi:AcrR family transcriptional regulator
MTSITADLHILGLKRQPNQTRGFARVNDILDACESLLAQKSFEEIGLNEIIKTAGVSKGTLYHFFEDKQSIFLSMMHRTLLEIDQQSIQRPGDDKLSFPQYMLKLERRLNSVWRKHQPMLDYYLTYRYRLDISRYEDQSRATIVDRTVDKLRECHPKITRKEAQNIISFLLVTLISCLDAASLSSKAEGSRLLREWRRMLASYTDTLGLN